MNLDPDEISEVPAKTAWQKIEMRKALVEQA